MFSLEWRRWRLSNASMLREHRGLELEAGRPAASSGKNSPFVHAGVLGASVRACSSRIAGARHPAAYPQEEEREPSLGTFSCRAKRGGAGRRRARWALSPIWPIGGRSGRAPGGRAPARAAFSARSRVADAAASTAGGRHRTGDPHLRISRTAAAPLDVLSSRAQPSTSCSSAGRICVKRASPSVAGSRRYSRLKIEASSSSPRPVGVLARAPSAQASAPSEGEGRRP